MLARKYTKRPTKNEGGHKEVNMASKTTGVKNDTKASANTPSGSRKGMPVGPSKSTAKLASVAKPVVNSNPIAGMKTNPKTQPMYTGKPSKPGKTATQYGVGFVQKGKAKGFDNNFPDQKRGSGRPVGGTQRGV